MDIKTERLDQCLRMVMDILVTRAAGYHDQRNSGYVQVGPFDTYTAEVIYDMAATLLADALDGNYDCLAQTSFGLPEAPAMPPYDDFATWGGWVVAAKRCRAPAPTHCPCTTCDDPSVCKQSNDGRGDCAAWRRWRDSLDACRP